MTRCPVRKISAEQSPQGTGQGIDWSTDQPP